jgi:hypothetical protein
MYLFKFRPGLFFSHSLTHAHRMTKSGMYQRELWHVPVDVKVCKKPKMKTLFHFSLEILSE